MKAIQECDKCELCKLEINKIKPLDENRIDRKIIFVGQNPSNNREVSNLIFEYQNISDKIMYKFLELIGITRNDVYFTNLVKCSTSNNEEPSKDIAEICINNFYRELDIVKPLIIISISKFSYKFIDKKKLKAPIVSLSHPSYFFRQTGDVNKAADMMYKNFLEVTIKRDLLYFCCMDLIGKNIYFKNQKSITSFFQNVNTMKMYNISLDGNYKTVITFVSKKVNYRVELKYHNYCWIKCDESSKEKYTIKGEPVKKLFYYKMEEVPLDAYEKDIHSDYRFIIDYHDYFIPITKEEMNIMTYDIETNGSVDVINTPKEITSIVYLLNGKYEFLMINNGNNNFDELKTKEDCKIFDKEKNMIEYFISIFRECNLVTGFNSSGFDIIYLMNRARKLEIMQETFSPLNKIKNNVIEEKDRLDEKNIVIYGLDVIDTMIYAKDKFFIYSLDKPSQYNLDYLGNFIKDKNGKVLGSKVYDSRGPATLWLEDPVKLYEYNIQDVKLCRQIEDYMGIVNYLLSFKQLMSTFNLKWSLYNSKIIDFFILCNYSKQYVFPSKGNNQKEDLKGAYVKEPIPGIYKNLAVFDYASLYPNIIRNYNLSYETISSNKEDFKDKIEVYDEDIKEYYYINKEKRGLMSEIVDKIMFMKTDISNQMKTSNDSTLPVKYNAIKAVINGIYGVFAYQYFRMYDIRIARCITSIGRTMSRGIADFIDKDINFKTIYQDTDSCFVEIRKDVSYEQAKIEFNELLAKANLELNNISKKVYGVENIYLKLEFETLFHRVMQTKAKKKYYGLGYYVKGKDYTELKEYGRGIDIVKKDTPNKLRPLLRELLISIVMSEKDDDIKAAIIKIKKEIYNMDYRDLLITKQISRELDEYKVFPQHVKAMQFSNKNLGTDFSRLNYKGGMLFVTCKGKYIGTEVIMIHEHTDIPKEICINYKKYFDLFVKNKMILFLDDFAKYFNENKTLDLYGISFKKKQVINNTNKEVNYKQKSLW